MKTTIFFFALLLFLTGRSQAQKVNDYDGNVYDTVQIGTLAWLKQNLKVTHYNDGLLIPNVTDTTIWATTILGARCYYGNDSAAYDSVYGALYNYYAVRDPRGICPEGWRVPTNADWQATEAFLGGSDIAGGKMKEAGTTHWLSPNAGATNSTGFTGLPGGGRDPVNKRFGFINENGLWWTSTVFSNSEAWGLYMWYMFAGIEHDPVNKKLGLSLRCVKDINSGIGELFNQGQINLYPNPAREKVTIILPEKQEITLSVYNILGAMVRQEVLTERTNELDLSSWPKGIYLIKANCAAWTFEQKLAKE